MKSRSRIGLFVLTAIVSSVLLIPNAAFASHWHHHHHHHHWHHWHRH